MKMVLDNFRQEDYNFYRLIRKFNNLLLEREKYTYDEFTTNLSLEEKNDLDKKREENINLINDVINKIKNELNIKLYNIKNDSIIKGEYSSSDIEGEREKLEKFKEFLNGFTTKMFKINPLDIFDNADLFEFLLLIEENNKFLKEINELSLDIESLKIYSNSNDVELNKKLEEVSEKYSRGKEKAKRLYDKLFKDNILEIKKEIEFLKNKEKIFEDTYRKEIILNTFNQLKDELQEKLKKIESLEVLDKEIKLDFLNISNNESEQEKNSDLFEEVYEENDIVEDRESLNIPEKKNQFYKKAKNLFGKIFNKFKSNKIKDKVYNKLAKKSCHVSNDDQNFVEKEVQKEVSVYSSKSQPSLNLPIQEHYSECLKELIRKVNENDFEALATLSDAYYFGKYNLTINYVLSFKILKFLEKIGGVGYCQYALGCDYQKGIGIEQDLDKALEYFEKATRNGFDCKKNIIEVKNLQNSLSEDAIEKQKLPSLIIGTTQIKEGETISPLVLNIDAKYSKELEDLIIKANAGDIKSLEQLANFSAWNNRYGISKNYKLSFKLMKEVERLGATGFCQYSLGFYYENGYGVPRDLSKAEEYYKKATNNGIDCTELISRIKLKFIENSFAYNYSEEELNKSKTPTKIIGSVFNKIKNAGIDAVETFWDGGDELFGLISERLGFDTYYDDEMIDEYQEDDKLAELKLRANNSLEDGLKLADYYYCLKEYKEALLHYEAIHPRIDCSFEIQDIKRRLHLEENIVRK